MSFLRRVAGVSLRIRVRSSAIWIAAAATLLRKESVEMVRASCKDVHWMPPFGDAGTGDS